MRTLLFLSFFSTNVLSFNFKINNQFTLRKVGHNLRMSADEYTIAILGDLHLDPRFMDDHIEGRKHFLKILEDGKKPNSAVVSLGDLGESKPVFEGTQELFAGTTKCFELAQDFLEGFKVPYEVVGGNHDLEGIDEFPTDQSNLEAYLRILKKPTAQFIREIAPKVLIVGLGSTQFRDSKYTSHEVIIDDPQIAWFENVVKTHRAEDGWKIFVFSHAPPMGSGLRVLQENHVVNGCCWLNHSGGESTRKFIELVRANPCIKAWFSGHFHLGQDYQDSITFPAGNNRGSCVFAQTSVIGSKSTRDKRRQSRLVRGNKNGFEICTVNHERDGEIRLDATITFVDETHETAVDQHDHEDYDHDKFFSAYTPRQEDGCYVEDLSGSITGSVCWWHMACGRVLGKHNGMLLEYDPSTLAPLGLVVGKDELGDRQIAIVDSGIETFNAKACEEACDPYETSKFENREQAIVLYTEGSNENITVIHPNEDGSYWRKIVRNKVVRMREKRREKAAERFIKSSLNLPAETKLKVQSSWGPYISTDGTAKKTSVPGSK